jgi:hypothetical protein
LSARPTALWQSLRFDMWPPCEYVCAKNPKKGLGQKKHFFNLF